MSGPKPKDLSGMRVGHLTVIEPVYITTSHGTIRKKWKCKCDCGRVKLFDYDRLVWKYGGSKSCGKCFSDDDYEPEPPVRLNGETIKIHNDLGYTFVYE